MVLCKRIVDWNDRISCLSPELKNVDLIPVSDSNVTEVVCKPLLQKYGHVQSDNPVFLSWSLSLCTFVSGFYLDCMQRRGPDL